MAVAIATKKWTLEELHSLPDDGNKYEVIHGELFVTPPPTDPHETIAARLTRILDPYVAANGLGYVYHPRAVLRRDDSEVEPDLMVRAPHPDPRAGWATAPIPILVVEILSPYTRRRDRSQKCEFYLEVGVEQYWIADPERREITVIRSGVPDHTTSDQINWHPEAARKPLVVELHAVFG